MADDELTQAQARAGIPNCYVYTLLDPRDAERVIYVGKGRGQRHKRPRTWKEAKRVMAFVAEHGNLPSRIVASGLTQEAAFSLEIELIAKYGRECDGGQLLNAALGGSGPTGCVRDAETRAKMSAGQKGKSLSEEHRAKLRKPKSPEGRANIGAARRRTRKPLSEEHKAAVTAALRGPEIRAKISEGSRKAWAKRPHAGGDRESRAIEWLAAKNSGSTFVEIAQKAGVSKEYIRHVVSSHPDYQPGRPRPSHALTLIETVRDLRAEGLTAAEVGRRLGMSRSAILGICHRHLKRIEQLTESPNRLNPDN